MANEKYGLYYSQRKDADFMLFKQAAGTGWDCLRAHILVMFRK